MTALYVVLISFLSFYALWVLYLAVMSLKRVQDAGMLHNTARVFGMPILVIGYVLDALVNIFILTILLVEIPEELTVTARLKRHIKESNDWRLGVACWFIPLLDPFDPSGKHIT
jgi:hypothetical protein